jgi:hypothetical protein
MTRGDSGAAMSQMVGAGAQVTHGGPVPEGGSWNRGGTWWPRSCPRPGGRSRSRGDTWQPWSCPQPGGGSRCLDLILVRGGTGPQGTDRGPRAHPVRGCEPAGGSNILFLRSLSESLYVGILKWWCSTADTWRPTIHADIAMLAEPSRAAVPRGSLLLSGNRRARGNHDHVPLTDGTPRIWDARGFHFSTAAPPVYRPVPTDERDLGPLVSAWVCGARGVGTKHCARWAAACRGG